MNSEHISEMADYYCYSQLDANSNKINSIIRRAYIAGYKQAVAEITNK